MASTFRLQIVTPDRMFYEDEVESVVLRRQKARWGF